MKKLLILLINIALFMNGYGQDMHTTMYYDSPVTTNPANTGMFNGYHRAHLQYRSQWSSVISKPYNNMIVSYEHPTEYVGLGGYITQTKEGVGGVSFLNVMASGAYDVSIPNSKQHIVCGLQLGIIYKSIHADRYLYESQYNVKSGEIDPNSPSLETFDKNGIVIPDANFGVIYRLDEISHLKNPFFGINLLHITQPKESFLGVKNRLKRRILMNAGTKIELNREITLSPQLLFMRQTNNNEFNITLNGGYKFRKAKQDAYMGVGYRTHDAVMITAGYSFLDYLVRFGYDINVSSLKKISRGMGAFEISISYMMQGNAGSKSMLKLGL